MSEGTGNDDRADRARRAAGLAAVYGLGTLLPASRLPRRATAATVSVVVLGVVAGGAVLPVRGGSAEPRASAGLRAEDSSAGSAAAGTELAPLRRRALTGVATGTLIGAPLAGATWLSLTVDAGAERWLRRRGVERPRVVMAAAAALTGGYLEYVDPAGRPSAES